MLGEGLELLVYGMGTVIVFLAMLVLATRILSATALRWFTPPEPEPAPSPVASGPSPQVLAAIAAAVHRYRREHDSESVQ